MGRKQENQPLSEALPCINNHGIVFHNGLGFYYTCNEYSSNINDRLFHCVRPECETTAKMQYGFGSPLVDDTPHSHPSDLTYREKCILLDTIRQKFLSVNSPALMILEELLSSLMLQEREDTEHVMDDSISVEEQLPLNESTDNATLKVEGLNGTLTAQSDATIPQDFEPLDCPVIKQPSKPSYDKTRDNERFSSYPKLISTNQFQFNKQEELCPSSSASGVSSSQLQPASDINFAILPECPANGQSLLGVCQVDEHVQLELIEVKEENILQDLNNDHDSLNSLSDTIVRESSCPKKNIEHTNNQKIRVRKDLDSDYLPPKKRNTLSTLPSTGVQNSNVETDERLNTYVSSTKDINSILNAARKFAKDYDYGYTWISRGGGIFAQKVVDPRDSTPSTCTLPGCQDIRDSLPTMMETLERLLDQRE